MRLNKITETAPKIHSDKAVTEKVNWGFVEISAETTIWIIWEPQMKQSWVEEQRIMKNLVLEHSSCRVNSTYVRKHVDSFPVQRAIKVFEIPLRRRLAVNFINEERVERFRIQSVDSNYFTFNVQMLLQAAVLNWQWISDNFFPTRRNWISNLNPFEIVRDIEPNWDNIPSETRVCVLLGCSIEFRSPRPSPDSALLLPTGFLQMKLESSLGTCHP